MSSPEDSAAMSPNKSRKGSGSVGTQEPSPDTPGPSGKRPFSEDDDFDYIPPKKGKLSSSKQSCKAGMRSPSYTPHNRPAELFRKDLISAMKLPDTDPLQAEDYVLIQDPWRQEWERGVQVPVNPTDFQVPVVSDVQNVNELKDFKMPRKFLHGVQDETYRQGIHELTGMQQLSEQVVRYDLDDLDTCWLNMVNEQRQEMGLNTVHEWTMEKVMESLENECHEKMSKLMRSEEILGIEYDANVACDVCRGKEGEDNNEMVFCDGCNMCVHQACYGITLVPDGDYMCRTCALMITPSCVLCPNKGGAMKSTKCSSQVELLVDQVLNRKGTKWAHVSCALWIPEVSIGVPERMEPITKLSAIPASRWALVCCLCKKKQGACIQCSVKTCKTAFHVTCGMKGGLVFNTDLEDENADGVKLRSPDPGPQAFCPKHSKRAKEEPDSPSKNPKDMTIEEKETYRKQKLEELKEAFYTVIDCNELARQLQLDEEIISLIFNFWKLKRKTNFNEPLLLPKADEAEVLENRQEKTIQSRMRMFVHLRQDLERVRNLCYMVSKREKMKRQYYNSHEALFRRLNEVLTDGSLNISTREAERMAREFKTVVSPVVEPPPLPLRAPVTGRRRGRKKKSDMNSNNSNAGDDISNLEENSNMTGDTDSQDIPHFRQSHVLSHDTDTQMSFNYDSSEDNPSPPQLSPLMDERPRMSSANDDDDAISCPDSVVDGADEQKEEEEEEVIVDSPPTPSPPAVSPSAESSSTTPPSVLPASAGPNRKESTNSTPRLKLSMHMRPLSAVKAGGQGAGGKRWAKPRAARRHRRLFGRRRKVHKKPERSAVREQSMESDQEPVWETVPVHNTGKNLKLSLTKKRQGIVKKEDVAAGEEVGAQSTDSDTALRHSDRLETRLGRGSGLSKHGQGETGAREVSPEHGKGSPQSTSDIVVESASSSSLESPRPHRSTRAQAQPDFGIDAKEQVEEEAGERRRPRQNGKLQRPMEARQLRTTRPRVAPKLRKPGALSLEQKHDLRLSSRREPRGPVSGGKEKTESTLQTGSSASERLQALLGSQDLKFTDEVFAKVQKSMSGVASVMGKHFNGHHAHEVPDSSIWKMDSNGRVKLDGRGKPLLNSQPSSRASSRVLNEISADKRKKTENVFGRSPTEQRLSRKTLASATATQTPGRTPHQDSPLAQSRSCGKREWPRHGDTALTPSELRSVKKNIFGEFEGLVPPSHTPDFRSLHQGPVEASPRLGNYRCRSPFSDDGDMEERNCSRESTPRRVTRSQHLDPDENSLGSFPQKTSATPPRLKEGLLKSSKFS